MNTHYTASEFNYAAFEQTRERFGELARQARDETMPREAEGLRLAKRANRWARLRRSLAARLHRRAA